MNRLSVPLEGAVIVVCAVLATSCSSGTPQQPAQGSTPGPTPAQQAKQPAAVPSQTAPAAAPAAAPATVLASGQYSVNQDVRCDLLEVKRVSGGAVLVKWRVVNTAAAQGGLTATPPKPIYYDGSWADLYYIDPVENKKYAYLTDAAGARILEVFFGDLPAGQQRSSWAKFPAPPPTSTKIAVHIPAFPPFEDVPLAQ